MFARQAWSCPGSRLLVSKSKCSSIVSYRQQLPPPIARRRRRRFNSSSTSTTSTSTTTTNNSQNVIKDPSFQDLKAVALAQAIPFIGFGFMDNSILIVAGDAIDTTLGVVLGISTLCAAAIGNIISDLAGIGLGTAIEDFCAQRLGLKPPDLTAAQRQLRKVRFAGQMGMATGMTIGCILGMFPLLFIDSDKIQNLKKKKHLESLFMDVVSEAKTLIGAESTCLYLRVTKDKEKQKKEKHTDLPFCPSVDGEYLYAMYYVLPNNATAVDPNPSSPLGIQEVNPSRFIPIGKGIVSRAVMTGKAWNIHDVRKEPDFSPVVKTEDGPLVPVDHYLHMVVVPVMDSQGRPIAVIRALNKKSDIVDAEKGFTDKDVEILKALASHISVSLTSVYQDQDDEEVRLRDTIRILKEQGIDKVIPQRQSKPLFPN